jgi:catalase
VEEAFRHCKAIAANAEGLELIAHSKVPEQDKNAAQQGLLLNKTAKDFEMAIRQHRFWEREKSGKIPA